jgi:hypothetical protein
VPAWFALAGRRAVPVVLDPARVLLFDPETGAAL